MTLGKPLADLARAREGRRRRASSWDRTGGNADLVGIGSGQGWPEPLDFPVHRQELRLAGAPRFGTSCRVCGHTLHALKLRRAPARRNMCGAMPRRYSMVRRAEKAQRTRAEVEMAMIRLLARESYGAISMSAIAKGAGISVRTVQRQYGSKDDVLVASLRHAGAALAEELSGRPETQSASEAIRQLVHVMYSLYNSYRREIWAAYSRSDEVPELAAAVMSAMYAWNSAIDNVLDRCVEELTVDRGEAKRALAALTSYQAWRGTMGPGGFGAPEAEEFVAGLLEWYLLRQRPSRS